MEPTTFSSNSQMVKRHWQGILECKLSSINNGILEGLNSVIQAAKRKARGYGKKHFKTMAYLLSEKFIINVLKINIKELRLLKIQTHKTTNKHLRTPQTS
jgi:hypothetical protein